MRYSLPILLCGGLLTAFSARATTIIPFANLADLYAASDAVVLIQAGTPYETPDATCTHYDCDFTVAISLKGPMAANESFSLRQHSHYDNWGHLDIAGDFVPKAGHSYLVFLNQNNDQWRLMMMSYYIFEQAGDLLVPVDESLTMVTFPRPDGVVAEPLTSYRKDALLQLLRQQGKGKHVPWDGRAAQATAPLADQVSDRALPIGCDFDLGTGTSRWQNQNINVYYDITGAPADIVARYTSTVATLNIEYSLGLVPAGPTDFSPVCTDVSVAGNDFVTFANSLNGNQTILLIFEDPCNEVPDLTGCNGVYGMGGGYTLNTTHTFKGDTWFNATWGYVVINNGARPCLTDAGYELLLTHEMTHSLRMDHLPAASYPNNNMNPNCCNPIGDKDRECMNYVYGAALPVELVAFDAKANQDVVDLTWTTAQEINNDYFVVERSVHGLQVFERLATVEASNTAHSTTYALTDEQPSAGTNYYRLSQVDRDGQTKELGIRAVNYRGEVSGYTLVPNPVSGNSIVLTARAKEPETGSLQIFSATGTMLYEITDRQKLTNNRLELPIGDLPAGIYWLKINENGRSEALKFVRQ